MGKDNFYQPKNLLNNTAIIKESQKLEEEATRVFNKNAKAISIATLAYSLSDGKKNDQELKKFTSVFHSKLESTTNRTEQLWMSGRLLISYIYANKQQEAETWLNDVTSKLANETYTASNPQNAFIAWSKGYVALAQALLGKQDAYQQTINELKTVYIPAQNTAYQQKPIADFLIWTYAMAIDAATAANDEDTYKDLLKQLNQTTGKENIIETLNLLTASKEDSSFKAWCTSIFLNAAEKFQESSENIKLLQNLFAKTLEETYPEDKLIASATYLHNQRQLEKENSKIPQYN